MRHHDTPDDPISVLILGFGVLCTLLFVILVSCLLLIDLWRRLRGRPGAIEWREEWRGLTRWVIAWGTYLPVRLWCIAQVLLVPMVAADISTSAFMPPDVAWEDRPAIMEWVGLPLVGLLFWIFVLPFGRRFWSRRPVRGWLAWSWCSVLPVAGTVLAHGPALNWFPSWPTFWPSYAVWIVTCFLFWRVVLRQYPVGELLRKRRKTEVAVARSIHVDNAGRSR